MSVDALDRLQRIESQIRSDGRVRVVDLAAQLDVSEMTIRRDLDMLAADGVVQRIRGGAVAIGPQPFADRFSRNMRAKDRIASKLTDLVGDGGAIGVDASSTLQRLTGHLGDVRDLTVVTNGQDTFAALRDLLAAGTEAGAYRVDDPELTAVLLFSAAHGGYESSCHGPDRPDEARLVAATQQLFRRAAGIT